MHSFRLAASAEMLYLDQPFVDRVRLIHSRGFEVEIWNWKDRDLESLSSTGAKFNSMTGYLEGDLLEPDGIARLLDTALQSIEASKKINCPNLNIHGTGLDASGQALRKKQSVTPAEKKTAIDTLSKIAALGEKHDKIFTLENLNLIVDHPGTPFGLALDVIELVEAVASEHLRMNLDLYHAQIGEGNLIELIRRAYPLIGEIQVADVPGRFEPGTGEINYRRIAAELKTLNYAGVVAYEGWASIDSDLALDRFTEIFA